MQRFDFESQRQKLHMSYLEVRPEKPNGPELGHAPQIQDPKQFHAALLERLLR